jgi:glutamyl-Q tRNA(Asp) synthetase
MEDVDTPRNVEGAADDILRTLEYFGFEWDGPVLFQSQRFEAYEETLQRLRSKDLVYACQCSRKQLIAESPEYGPLGIIYPGHCRALKLDHQKYSQRLNLSDAGLQRFTDLHSGPYELDISQQVGDPVMKRIDGIYAYHLAVVVDDAWQEINTIVRGADLLEVTSLHLYLNELLDFETSEYLHIPLIHNPDGKKLSKQTGARALDRDQSVTLLLKAMETLGQAVEPELNDARNHEVIEYAINHWDRELIP